MSINQHGPEIHPSAKPFASLERFTSQVKRLRTLKGLHNHQKRITYLAQNFDPFGSELDNECQQIVAMYGLETVLTDPFKFTNVLLQMLDALEERGRELA